jgi:hypothetical protein
MQGNNNRRSGEPALECDEDRNVSQGAERRGGSPGLTCEI